VERILIVGKDSSLGNCLKKLESDFPECEFLFTSSKDLDITKEHSIREKFEHFCPDYCINTSAYTAVDSAEGEKDESFAINAFGVEKLAKIAEEHYSVFLHVSTDYVFDGETNIAYTEEDIPNPQGVYAESKRRGEILALENNSKCIIIRTSWLYSEFKTNFVKTILNLSSNKKNIGVVADQFGQPTNTHDLAKAIMQIVKHKEKKFGIYHYSNFGEVSWYEFAKKIAELSGVNIKIKPLTTTEYPTVAPRPKRSTLYLNKIEEDYNIIPEYWENSLELYIKDIFKAVSL